MDHRSSPAVNLCWITDCTSPLAPSGHLCDSHLGTLFVALAKVPDLDTELEVTRARQDKLTAAAEGGRSAQLPLAFSWNGAEAAWTLENTIMVWAVALARALHLPLDQHGRPEVLATVKVTAAPRHARGHTIAVQERTIDREVDVLDEETGDVTTVTVTEVVPARYHDDPAAIVPPASLTARAATWLAHHLGDVAALGNIPEAFDEITHVVGVTRHVIDRAPARLYVGTCDECGTAMYARLGARVVQCPNRDCKIETTPARCAVHGDVGEWCAPCRTSTAKLVTAAVVERPSYDVEARREWMLDAAQDYMVTAVEATAALPVVAGITINVNTLRQAARDRGARHAELDVDYTHPDGRARYRLGDVIDLARRIGVRRAG